jgi:2-hydroxychromene-2-carboxylate isomerase
VSLELQLEIWEVLQEHIVDIKDAADDFVALLIENGIDGEKIAATTTSDDIKKSLMDYIDVEVDEDYVDDEDGIEY